MSALFPKTMRLCRSTGFQNEPAAATRNGRSVPNATAGLGGRCRGPCHAFTLLEILIVMGIISILLGMLLTAIQAVTRFSRETITRTELRMLEGAWKQYHAHYRTWPTNLTFWAPDPEDDPDARIIDHQLARALEGREEECKTLGFNPEHLNFMEFTRYDRTGAPVNPWGNIQSDQEHLRFRIRIDVAAEGTLPNPDPATRDEQPDIAREVIVWTYDDRGDLIGSWQQ